MLVPSACSAHVAEAAAHERRHLEASAKLRKRELENERWQQKREKVERDAADACKASEDRRSHAERNIEITHSSRKAGEAEHRRVIKDELQVHTADIAASERKTEALRSVAGASALAKKRDAAARKERGAAELQKLRDEAERWRLDLERTLADEEAVGAAAVKAANRRVQEAQEAAGEAWRKCEETAQGVHAEAHDHHEQHASARAAMVNVANQELASVDAQLEEQLRLCTEAERAAREDRAAEARAAAVGLEVGEDIRRMQAECEAFRCETRNEMLRLARQAGERADAAARQVVAAQEAADREVQHVSVSVQDFAEQRYRVKLQDQHKTLNDRIDATRRELADRVDTFRQDATRLLDEANQTLLSGDHQVESVRTSGAARVDNEAEALHKEIERAQLEKTRVLAEAEEKMHRTQGEMVKYIGTQHEQMLDRLAREETPDLPLRLDVTGQGFALNFR